MHTLDASAHAGGWSVDAHVEIPAWDRGGLERLVRYCARPPLAQERLGRLDDVVRSSGGDEWREIDQTGGGADGRD